jgi:membrane protease YdiL (CAAX protease family)
MLLHIIPYSAVGVAFGYAYKEHNNIIGTMLIHAIHNTIAIIEIIIFM